MFRSIDNTIHSDFGSNAPQQQKKLHTQAWKENKTMGIKIKSIPW